MPGNDYTAAVGGGLKLKGVNSSSKVSKHKKKKPKPESNPAVEEKPEEKASTTSREIDPDASESVVRKEDGDMPREDEATPPPRAGKTEAEVRHEERRRKHLDERLKREGTKTHKERVEELNRYLSNLSEHHDMYAHIRFELRHIWEKSNTMLTLPSYTGRESDPDKDACGGPGEDRAPGASAS